MLQVSEALCAVLCLLSEDWRREGELLVTVKDQETELLLPPKDWQRASELTKILF